MVLFKTRRDRQLAQVLTQVYLHEPVAMSELKPLLKMRWWGLQRSLDELARNKVLVTDTVGPYVLYSISDLTPLD